MPLRRRTLRRFRPLRCEPLESRQLLAANFAQFVDPNPSPGNLFGSIVVPLSTGNVVVTSPLDDFGAPDAGAVYLFNGATGALISTIRGSHANDHIGFNSVIALTNGNFVFRSFDWDDGGRADVGAVTWGSGTVGVKGVVSATNSLIGSTANDRVGSNGLIPLPSGNYVVLSSSWDKDNGAIQDAGAVTWADGTTGIQGAVSAANSLVGGSANDKVGFDGVTELANGNYVVSVHQWDNGAAADAGAATWGSGTTGVQGVVSPANSLVGSTANDQVGSFVTPLPNGNYVVRSTNWSNDNGATAVAGAVTWGDGTKGVKGLVSSANSLVGSTANDFVGANMTVLTNSNFVVISNFWDNGATVNAGAVTWVSGTAGIHGVVNSANSLVGSSLNDAVGGSGVKALANGNYVVSSRFWDNGAAADAGAVTWGSGTTGVSGVVSSANSLVGTSADDAVGNGVTPLTNGNYVVISSWSNGATAHVGAVTWADGATGLIGVVSAANSLIGSTANDFVGIGGVRALANGNYVAISPNWDNGATANVGAVTWASGATGLIGVVSTANSLFGSTANDQVGNFGVVRLDNGSYLVRSPSWDDGATANVGAVTWGSGTSGVQGAVSSANSLIGSTAEDVVGNDQVFQLANGNYVVTSSFWDNGAAQDAGAATWGSGTTGVSGVISAANSLIGTSQNDRVSSAGLRLLPNGNYIVLSHLWDNGAAKDAGAITWGSGTVGVKGFVSSANSLIGSTENDQIGTSVAVLSNSNYLVRALFWDNGAAVDAGAVTWGSGVTGISGVISTLNSAVGATANADLRGIVVDDPNQSFYASFFGEGGGTVRVGSQFNGFQPAPTLGLSGTATYTENMVGGLVLAPGAAVDDVDSPDFSGGKLTVTITANASSDDRFFIKSGTPAPGVISVSGSSVLFNTTKIGDITGSGVGSTPREITLNANATLEATKVLVRAISFFVASDSPSTAQRTIEYALTDGDGFSSNPATKFVKVKAVNDAPVLDTSGNPTLPTIAEDATNPAGAQVASLLVGAVTDPDANALRGIAVTAASNFNGTWQFSTNDGATWQALGEPTSAAARLLAGWTRVRFIPNANFNGTVKLFYRAWDQTQGTNGGTFDTSGHTGGTNSLSTAFESAALTVTPVNDAPVLATSGNPTLPSVPQNATDPAGTTVSTLLTGAVTDSDAGALQGIAVTVASNFNGTWQFSTNGGATWQGMNEPSNSAALLLADSVRIRFVPKTGFFGTVKLFYRAWDQTEGSNGGTLNTTGHTGGSKSLSTAVESASLTVTAG